MYVSADGKSNPIYIEMNDVGTTLTITPQYVTSSVVANKKIAPGSYGNFTIKLIKPEPFMYTTSLIVLVIGIIVGMTGSASAVKKYLKILIKNN